jgi:tetratricopeptide (TPR) repeat protein
VLKGHQQFISRLQLAGQRLLSECSDLCRLWDVSRWEEVGDQSEQENSEALLTISKESSWPLVAFSRDFGWLADVQADGVIRLWQAGDGKRILPVQKWISGNTAVLAIAFSDDRQQLLSASTDGTVREWPVELGSRFDAPLNDGLVMDRAEVLVGRNLTSWEWQRLFENEPYRKTLDELPVHVTTLNMPLEALRNHQIDETKAIDWLTEIFRADNILEGKSNVDATAKADANYFLHLRQGMERARHHGDYSGAEEEFKRALKFTDGPHGRLFNPERRAKELAFWWWLEEGRRLALQGAEKEEEANAKLSEAAQLASAEIGFDPVAEFKRIPASMSAQAQITEYQRQLAQIHNLIIMGNDIANVLTQYEELASEYPTLFNRKQEARWLVGYAKNLLHALTLETADRDRAAELLKLSGQLDESQPVVDIQTVINRMRAQALLQQGADDIARYPEKLEAAKQKFAEAAQLDPTLGIVPDAWARQIAAPLLALDAQTVAASGNIDDAIVKLQQAKDYDQQLSFDPKTVATKYVKTEEIEGLIRQGRISEAVNATEKALASDPTQAPTAEVLDRLCWYGCLLGHAQKVRFAGERAVRLAPAVAIHWETRGLARALTGHPVEEVITDFEVFLAWSDIEEEMRSTRQLWIEALRAGEKPEDVFTPEVLQKLQQEGSGYLTLNQPPAN